MKVGIYIRVSTPNKKDIGKGKDNPFLQKPEVQLEPLARFAEFKQWDTFKVYQDRMTGSKNVEARPGFKSLWNDVRKGLINVVLVWRFDRFARTSLELLRALQEFESLGVDFVSYTENIDTSTAMGKAMYTMIAAFAEMERSNTIERINSGIEYAKEHGTKSGKAIGRPKKIFRRDRAIELRLEGKSIRQIAQELGQSPSAIADLLKGVQKPRSEILSFRDDLIAA